MGGDVQLANSDSQSVPRFEAEKIFANLKSIESNGEQNGLYSYSLNDKYTLHSKSSVRLPFIDMAVKYRFYYTALINIDTEQDQGVFQRNYDLTPDHFIPAGIITIRDNNVLVGQSNLPDVPQNYTQTISVGQDNDIRYLVKGNLTSKSNDNASVSFETYQLDVHIMNFKNKKVDAQLVLQGGIQINLHQTTCNSAQVNGNQLNLPIQLEQGEHRICNFNVTVKSA